jgi:uncharacterized LabA/DUF88 family protein
METDIVAVFIDGSNLYKALFSAFGNSYLDYEAFVRKLLGDRKLLRTYYYNALPNQSADPLAYQSRQRFIEALRHIPYFQVVLGRIEYREQNGNKVPQEKGVDIRIAVDMLDLAFKKAYNTAILVSGDSDFDRAIEVVKAMGFHVENVRVEGQNSKLLDQCCDKTTILDTVFLDGCWRNVQKGENHSPSL